jgi:starch-binding outer membrane protein, SusD/RagB family
LKKIKKMKNYLKIATIAVLFSAVTLQSCKKFVDAKPNIEIPKDLVFSTDGSAAAAVTGLYVSLAESNQFFGGFSGQVANIPLLMGLSADELSLNGGGSNDQTAYYKNTLSTTGLTDFFWNKSYNQIYTCNSILEGLEKSTTLTPNVKLYATGEAKFMRAFYYFYLVNLYGNVPFTTTTDVAFNKALPRLGTAAIYQQIIADLKDAKEKLPQFYLYSDLTFSDNNRVRPNYWAATALLARTYLYTKDYTNAALQATEIIDNTTDFDVAAVSLNDVFLKNSYETIWAIQPTGIGKDRNTGQGKSFVLGFGFTNPVNINDTLFKAFEPGDDRKNKWIKTTGTRKASNKYKVGNEDVATKEFVVMLRVAEQYLIRAEARANKNDIAGAADDLNVIRTRAREAATTAVPDPLPDIDGTSINQTDVLKAIAQERKVELFTEWGHRWFDLKRTGAIDTIMPGITTKKGGIWESFRALLPIPQADIDRNPALTGQQNPGY